MGIIFCPGMSPLDLSPRSVNTLTAGLRIHHTWISA